MNNQVALAAKVTTSHQARLAYIYVRQSSLGQVLKHQESTDLQYRLVERAVQLGWPRERVGIIDDDLGKSGASAEHRHGFQHLLAEIGLGKVGLVISLDASRLARNNRDWYQLLELCSLFGALIADGEQLYDPRAYHDRLLLGLSGMMSEAELHHLKMRLQQGERHKAARGELRLPLPAGLSHSRTGEIMLNPDEEVQARLRLVFQKFRELKSAKAVVRYFQQHNLALPIRPLSGPAPHEIEWRPANSTRVGNILKNPAYAGAYVYGRRTVDPLRRRPEHARSGTVRVPIEEWEVCLREAHPGYISWEEFLANQQQLQDNTNQFEKGRRGVPRKGMALLQGIVFCGCCGRRMRVAYSGPHGEYPVYLCNADSSQEGRPHCQEVRALQVDVQIEQLVLAALAPDQLALALEAISQLEEEARTLQQQWKLRLERVKYGAERARRQYDAVEPENRLVARQLEQHWEEQLRRVEETEREYQCWLSEQLLALTETDRAEILALGEDLPRLWYAPTTTAADRKQIVRFIIKEVILNQKCERGQVIMKINWQTGANSEYRFRRKVHAYEQYAELEALRQRIQELNNEQKLDAEIAAQLNAEGFISALGKPFQSGLIFMLRKKWRIPTVKINSTDYNPARWPDGTFSVTGAAAALEVAPITVFAWLRKGKLPGEQLSKGMPWKISLTDEQISELKSKVRRINRSSKEAA
jgi:DNA invertase Pin-like site-specific DNA recombinase